MPSYNVHTMSTASPRIQVEVACANSAKQLIVPVMVASDARVIDAVQQSGILSHFPEIDMENLVVGIFGSKVRPQSALNQGDRVEIYRPLQANPMEARKRRASVKRI